LLVRHKEKDLKADYDRQTTFKVTIRPLKGEKNIVQT